MLWHCLCFHFHANAVMPWTSSNIDPNIWLVLPNNNPTNLGISCCTLYSSIKIIHVVELNNELDSWI